MVLFPYISLFRTPFDTQPFAVIFSILIFLILLIRKDNDLSFPFPLWVLSLIFLYALGMYFIHSDYYYGIRSLAGYASVFFIALASYKTFKYINIKIYFLSIFIWCFFGVVQLLFKKTFGSWLVPRMSTSVGRGVTSLATEPSHYATVCIFLLILNEIFHGNAKYNNKIYFIIMIILVFQVIMSFSGLGILFLMGFFFTKCISLLLFNRVIKNWRAFLFTIIILSIIVLSFFYLPVLENSRAGRLFTKTVNTPALLFADQSVADRASHILISFYSLPYSNGIGLGLGTWDDYAQLLASSAGRQINNLTDIRFSASGRIMSGWGTAVYELGIVGILFILVFLYIMFIGMYKNKKMKPVYALSMAIIGLIMLMAVPLAFPLFGYALGIFLYYAYGDYKQKRIKSEDSLCCSAVRI